MTTRLLLVTCAAAALISTGTVEAAPRGDGRSVDFLASLFGAPQPPAPVATAAPISVLPPAAMVEDPARPAGPRRAVVAHLPPVPRLRPAYAPAVTVATADPRPATAAAATLPNPGIDETTTGSIDGDGSPRVVAPPPPYAATPEPQEPANSADAPRPAAPATQKREITTVQRSDGLLGDPSDYLPEEPNTLEPKVSAPETVEGPFRTKAPANGKDEAALAAVPLLGTEPFELVRTLQSLQDRMARGDVQAIAAQRALMVQIDKAFMAAETNVWQDNRNAAAAVTYVLSGGQPEILTRLTALDPPPSIDRRLLLGVLSYASGKPDEAAPLLADIEPTGLPASMAGQVAIAQSALAVRNDPAKAMQLLAVARLLAPGTLVEEAAIRRQLLVADRQRDEGQVRSLARQYLDRFRHSVYAGNFRVRFAAALSHMSTLDSEDHFGELDDMLAMVEPDSRCDLYLTVALASAVSGRATAARLAAERASGLALAGSLQEARAKLYHAAALAAMPELTDKAAAEIKTIDRNLIAAPDQALYETVAATLTGVLSGTDLAKIDVAAAAPLGDGALVEEPDVVKKARAALDETKKLVASAK
jgi:chemotaxis protein MotC